MGLDVQVGERTVTVELVTRPPVTVALQRAARGATGADAAVSVGFYVEGPFAARHLIVALIIPGDATFTSSASAAEAFSPATGATTWFVTKGGTFVDPTQATALEIAAALFATITFPSGPGPATVNYLDGGAVVAKDIIRVWESLSPDASLANSSVIFAGD